MFLFSVEFPEQAINLHQRKENLSRSKGSNKVLLLFLKDQTKYKDVTEAGWGT